MRSSSRASLLVDADPSAVTAAWTLDELGFGSRGTSSDRSYTRQRPEEVAAEHARAEQERLVQEAYSSGYEEGRLAGEIAEGMRLRNAIAATETALDEIRENESQWQQAVDVNIAALAVAIARQVVGHELETNPATVADLVKRALAEFPIDQPLRVRVNPLDLSILSAPTTPTGAPISIAPNRDVRWLADSRIASGGCVIEGRERIIDGRVDTALERIYRRLSATDA